jgi:hypothetical protein
MVSILISKPENNRANINLDAMNLDERAFVPKTRDEAPDVKEFSKLSFESLMIKFRKELHIPRPSRSKCLQMLTYLNEKRLEERVSLRLEAEDAAAKELSVGGDERPGKKRKRASAPKSGGRRRQGRRLDASDSDNEDALPHLPNIDNNNVENSLPRSDSQEGRPSGAEGSTAESKTEEHENRSIRDDLDRLKYPTIGNFLIELLKKHGLAAYIPYVDAMKRKCKMALNVKSKPKVKHKPYPRTGEALERLLGRIKDGPNLTVKDEEFSHPWSVATNVAISLKPLMRGWWFNSECLIHHGIGFFSGGSDILLDTAQKRNLAIGDHADWGNRRKTPFISTATSLSVISRIMNTFVDKETERGIELTTCKLTLINPNARLAAGFPILSMKNEIEHYKVKPRCGNLASYGEGGFFNHEYLLPFYSGIKEIVGTWLWRDIIAWMNVNGKERGKELEEWYKAVALPKFRAHEQARIEGREYVVAGGGCVCCCN